MQRSGAHTEGVRDSFRTRMAVLRVQRNELAHQLGISLSLMSRIMNGSRPLTPEMERRIDIELQVFARVRHAARVAADAERRRARRELCGAASAGVPALSPAVVVEEPLS